MTIPSYVQPINAGGKADTVWYNWFQQIERLLQASGTDTSDLAEAISQIDFQEVKKLSQIEG